MRSFPWKVKPTLFVLIGLDWKMDILSVGAGNTAYVASIEMRASGCVL